MDLHHFRVHCPTLSETAVGEFLKGRRSIGLEYLEAIVLALGEIRKVAGMDVHAVTTNP